MKSNKYICTRCETIYYSYGNKLPPSIDCEGGNKCKIVKKYHIMNPTKEEIEELYNREMPLICECKNVTFEELLIENPSIHQEEYLNVISSKELLEKWKELQVIKQKKWTY